MAAEGFARGDSSLSGTSVWRPQSRYTVSRIECRIKFPQNQRCRAKIALHPPQSRCNTFLRTPPSHFALICSRQGAKGGGYRGGLVEGTAALLGSENGSRYRGVSQLQSHQSRYSVQLRFFPSWRFMPILCLFKLLGERDLALPWEII